MKLVDESLDQFITEKFDPKTYKPLEGTFGTTIDGKDIEATVQDLVNFSKDYPTVNLPVDKLCDIGLWKMDKFKKTGTVKPEGSTEWKKYKDLTDEQKKDFDDEVQQTIDKSNLKYPIIVCKGKKGKLQVLDGNHRVEKACKLKKSTIIARVIPEEDILKKFKK